MKPAFIPLAMASAATVSLYCHVPSEILHAPRKALHQDVGARQESGDTARHAECRVADKGRTEHAQWHLHSIVEFDARRSSCAHACSDCRSLGQQQRGAKHPGSYPRCRRRRERALSTVEGAFLLHAVWFDVGRGRSPTLTGC